MPSCRTNKAPHTETDKVGMWDDKINIPDYFGSSANKATDKRASKVLPKKIPNELSDVFLCVGGFEGTFSLKVEDGS